MSDRILPHSLDAEKSVLGAVLLQRRAFAEVSALVEPADFYHPAHGAIYAAMVALDGASRPIDALTVAEQLRTSETTAALVGVGGESYLAELTSAVASVENVAFHARIVRGKSLARQLIEAAQEIAAKGYGDYGEPDDFAAEAERAIFAVCERAQPAETRRLDAVLAGALRVLEERDEERKRGRTVVGSPSGLACLDELLGGFRASNVYVIAARPAGGKTSFARQVAVTGARQAVPWLIFSLEMTAEEQTEGILASDANLNGLALRNGWLDAAGWLAVTKSASRLASLPLRFVDMSDLRLRDIRAIARRWRLRETDPHKPAGIVIDYLQLVEGDDERKDKNREREIARVSRGVKKLSRELRVPVLLLSQLNRGGEQGEGKPRRPRLSDLRESGAIEQDADFVIFLHPVGEPDEGGDQDIEGIVGKARFGPSPATVKLRFCKSLARFDDPADVVGSLFPPRRFDGPHVEEEHA